MKKRRTTVTVPLSQTLGLGQWDTTANGRDSQRDKLGTDEAKVPVFIKLQRDTKRDSEETRASEDRPTAVRHLGRGGTIKLALTPELRQWIDRVIVPALVRDFLADLEEHASENPPSVGDCSSTNEQSPEEAK